MDSVMGKSFRNQQFALDATKTMYFKCTFEKCEFIYFGGDNPLINCNLDNCNITITGEAGKVLGFMQAVGMITPPPQAPPAIGQRPESGSLH